MGCRGQGSLPGAWEALPTEQDQPGSATASGEHRRANPTNKTTPDNRKGRRIQTGNTSRNRPTKPMNQPFVLSERPEAAPAKPIIDIPPYSPIDAQHPLFFLL